MMGVLLKAAEPVTPDARQLERGDSRAARQTLPKGELLLVALASAIAALLRLPYLGSMSLWLDEIWSIGVSRMSWASVISVVLHRDSNASLYYVLLHEWMRMSHSEAHVRLLSVLMGVATVPLIYALGRHLVSAQVGLTAAFLTAINGYHILFSQEARGYTLAVLLVTCSSLLFVSAVELPTAWNWCGYVLTSVLAIYAHVFAGFVLAAQWASLLLLPRRELRWKRFIASALIIGALVAPVGILVYERMREPMAPLAWVPQPSLRGVTGLFWLLAGNTSFVENPTLRDAVRGVPLLAVYFLACLAALVCTIKVTRNCGRSFESWRLGLPFSWLLVPIVSALLLSTIKPIFVSRYLLICLPATTLLAAIGIGSLRSRRATAAALAVVIVLAIVALPYYYEFRSRNHEWQAATDYILSHARPGDAAIFFVAPGRLLFNYYRARYNGRAADINVLYPEFGNDTNDPAVLAYLPPVMEELPTHATSNSRRVWLVLYHDGFSFTAPVRRQILASLAAANYHEVGATEFDGYHERIDLRLYVQDSPQLHTSSEDYQRLNIGNH